MLKVKKILQAGAATILTLCLSGMASAQVYVGASIGLADSGDVGKTSNISRLFAGYRIIEFIALEVAASEFGSIDKPSNAGSIDLEGYEYAIVGTFPFAEKHEIYARLGQINWELDEDNGEFSVNRIESSDDGKDTVTSLGYAIQAMDFGAVRVEINRYNILDDDVNTIMFGLEARF